jgi:hypothetical protein
LLQTIEVLPQGKKRKNALRRIARLDCNAKGDDLASCVPNTEPPPAATQWRKFLEAGQVDEAKYSKALAQRLRVLVCRSDANAIHILRGVATSGRLTATGREAPALIDDILAGNNCPVSSALADDDETRLREIKAEALKKYPPEPSPPAAKADPPSAASPAAPPVKAPAKSARRHSGRDPAPP